MRASDWRNICLCMLGHWAWRENSASSTPASRGSFADLVIAGSYRAWAIL